MLAVGFRLYEGINELFKRPTKMCWRVNRGDGLSPVESCEGRMMWFSNFGLACSIEVCLLAFGLLTSFGVVCLHCFFASSFGLVC